MKGFFYGCMSRPKIKLHNSKQLCTKTTKQTDVKANLSNLKILDELSTGKYTKSQL